MIHVPANFYTNLFARAGQTHRFLNVKNVISIILYHSVDALHNLNVYSHRTTSFGFSNFSSRLLVPISFCRPSFAKYFGRFNPVAGACGYWQIQASFTLIHYSSAHFVRNEMKRYATGNIFSLKYGHGRANKKRKTKNVRMEQEGRWWRWICWC